MLEILADSLIDCAKLLPFLFLSYLAVEYIEHKMSHRTRMAIYRAGKAGPLFGGLLGVIPQCGFAAAAAGLYAGGIVTPGTLLAVFLSTSDEMLPIMVSVGAPVGMISKILIVKVIVAIAAGLILDLCIQYIGWPKRDDGAISHMCEQENCHCEEGGIWKGALNHTAQVIVFLFVITFVLGFIMEHIEAESLSQMLGGVPLLEEALAGAVGMIPNCAASVLMTKLYLQNMISSGALFAGLLCGAGAGLLVLYRANRRLRENLIFTVILYVAGVIAGILAGAVVSLA